MDLPVIQPPIFPRWVWIEEITYSHIPIATLITAFMTLAPVFEYVGYRRNDPRYDRLARSLIWFSLILFSPGAALGTGIPMWIIGTYPEFWSRFSNLFFWPLIVQFVFFLAEVVFLFFFYYLAWDTLATRKRLHIGFGVIAATFGLLIQAVWDSLGSYMLTPGAPLPGIHEPVAWSAAAFFNPSFPYLFWHRFFGNISYTMLLTGGVFALRAMRHKDPGEKSYYNWASNLMFTIGFLSFFAMPFIGWGYARILSLHAPVAFRSIMAGHTLPHFTVKMGFVTVLAVVGAAYLFVRYKGRALAWGITLGFASLYVLLRLHPPVSWFGTAGPWYDLLATGFGALLLGLWLIRGRLDPERKPWRWAMFGVGVAATCAFLIGGFVRSRSRSPYTVYRQIEKPEALDWERGRFLVHDRCLDCHGALDVLADYAPRDWEERLEEERRRPGWRLSDEEARQVLTYLNKVYP